MQIGDFVRVSKSKRLFEPGYTANYSTEIFKVAQVKLSNPRTYILKDINGEKIEGRFYETELMKTKYPHQYLIERVVRKKGDKVLAKFHGFEKPEWINKTDFV